MNSNNIIGVKFFFHHLDWEIVVDASIKFYFFTNVVFGIDQLNIRGRANMIGQ